MHHIYECGSMCVYSAVEMYRHSWSFSADQIFTLTQYNIPLSHGLWCWWARMHAAGSAASKNDSQAVNFR